MNFIREKVDMATRSWTSTFSSLFVGFLALTMLRSLFTPPYAGPSPDLVKVAGLVHSFEPLIVYSEHGVQQISELQETGVAVWDLGESVRHTNMTSAPIIVRELDDLSEGVKRLAIELTRFFANVNGDVDSILITIDWAKRELARAQSAEMGALQTAFTNIHSVFCRLGVFEGGGKPTAIGRIVTELFGQTAPQRSKAALQRTFHGFLEVLEESINQELKYSLLVFGLFETVERQFLNLVRTVQREEDIQREEEMELLGSLWVQLVGARDADIKKFERNRVLLSDLRKKTLRSKTALVEHNQRLMQLKENLEVLRKKLVSPLFRGMDSTLSVEEQIAGLEDTHSYLKSVRERQRTKSLEMLYGAGNRAHITQDAPMEIASGR
ncbi:MAG: hypothetical protein INR71_01315 [Terriglobus roseus]|nr:hypothetical protein [Terriglobus roseus]